MLSENQIPWFANSEMGIQMNESKLFQGKLETYVNSGGILAKKWNLLEANVLFIPFFVFGFGDEVTKIRK